MPRRDHERHVRVWRVTTMNAAAAWRVWCPVCPPTFFEAFHLGMPRGRVIFPRASSFEEAMQFAVDHEHAGDDQ